MTTRPNTLGIGAYSLTDSARAGWAVFAAAIGLGLAGDLLLRAWPIGPQCSDLAYYAVLGALILPRFESLELPRARGTGWLCAAAVFSLMLVWRASPVLQTLNVITVVLCLGMVAFRTTAAAVRAGSLTEYGANAVATVAQVDVGMGVLLARHLDWAH